MIDLFGRGYSDTPADMPHDARLFITQILLVISSSPLPWTGHTGFNLVGYSLGGGVSVSFTRYLPHLVQSLTLIAPGGLIRPNHIGWKSKVLYSRSFLPEFLLEYLVKRRLQPQLRASTPPGPIAVKDADEVVGTEVPDAEGMEAKGDSDATRGDTFDNAVLSKRFPHISVASAVSWQVANHAGFIPAFMSSIRYAPIYNQHAVWATIGARLSEQKANPEDEEAAKRGLHRSKVLMILGATDPVVLLDEVSQDAKAVLGEGNVEISVLESGHELPITKSAEVAEVIWKFWTEGIGRDNV
jgi:pimeloyl-ACP methyl ester carboxylesterase